MELFINILLVIVLGISLISDFYARKRTSVEIETIWRRLRSLTPIEPPRSHVLLGYSNAVNAAKPGIDPLINRMREKHIRAKHEQKRFLLLTQEEKDIEAANANKADEDSARKKEVQNLIRLIANDFFIDVKEEGDADHTRFCASMFGVHLISVLEGKEPTTKEHFKHFPKAKAAEIKAVIDRWVNDGCPY